MATNEKAPARRPVEPDIANVPAGPAKQSAPVRLVQDADDDAIEVEGYRELVPDG